MIRRHCLIAELVKRYHKQCNVRCPVGVFLCFVFAHVNYGPLAFWQFQRFGVLSYLLLDYIRQFVTIHWSGKGNQKSRSLLDAIRKACAHMCLTMIYCIYILLLLETLLGAEYLVPPKIRSWNLRLRRPTL